MIDLKNRPMLDKIVVVAIVLLAGLLWWRYTPAPAPVGQWHAPTTSPEVKNVPKQDITPPKVAVYAPAAKKKLNLPPGIQEDPHSYVLDSARLPADTHAQTVTTIIDERTGETKTITRREPDPWLALEDRGSAAIYYGTKRGLPLTRMMVTEEVLQIKALHLGATASLDSDGAVFAGVGVVYRW